MSTFKLTDVSLAFAAATAPMFCLLLWATVREPSPKDVKQLTLTAVTWIEKVHAPVKGLSCEARHNTCDVFPEEGRPYQIRCTATTCSLTVCP